MKIFFHMTPCLYMLKTLQQPSSSRLKGKWLWTLHTTCSIRDTGPTKFVHIMILDRYNLLYCQFWPFCMGRFKKLLKLRSFNLPLSCLFSFDNEICSKTCPNRHSEKNQNLVFKTYYCLMEVNIIQFAECAKQSILQYFQP